MKYKNQSLLLLILLAIMLCGCTPGDVVMPLQREAALRSDILEVGEEVLFRSNGNVYIYKEGVEIECRSNDGTGVILTSKHIILVNPCSEYDDLTPIPIGPYNDLPPVIKLSYKDITELVQVTTITFGIQHPWSTKIRAKEFGKTPIRVHIYIRPIRYSKDLYSIIEKHIPKGTPAFSRDMLEDKKYNYTWP